MAVELEELTGKIIGAANEALRQLEPGFIESIDGNALVYELRQRGLKFEQQLEAPIFWDGGVEVGKRRLDFLVAGGIGVDLKAISELLDIHFAIRKSQLLAVKRRRGLRLTLHTCPLDVKRAIALCEFLFAWLPNENILN
jgi:GxxExxY protein